MVQVEGIGKQPPSPSPMKLTAAELQELIREAKRRSGKYRARSDQWGRGMTGGLVIANIGSIDDVTTPVFVGLCGEYVLSELVNRHCHIKSPIDLTLLPGGDPGHDLEFLGLKVQVKTRRRDYGEYLVRQHDKSLDHADVFAFATWGGQTVTIDGCIGRGDVLACEVKDAPGGREHKNHVVKPCDLLPICRLYASIRSRQCL